MMAKSLLLRLFCAPPGALDGTAYDNLAHTGCFFVAFGPYSESADGNRRAKGVVYEAVRVASAGLGFNGDETLTFLNGRAATPGSCGFNTPIGCFFLTA